MAAPETAFVLGGGGTRGAVEVGMLRALLEHGIVPDLIVGTSIGSINGALLAADPTPSAIETLTQAWTSTRASKIFGDGFFTQASRVLRSRTHLNSPGPLRSLLETNLGIGATFDQLDIRLKVVAASIERASEHVFETGPLIPAILASAAVPGLFPPANIDGEHFIDGGIVNSIPISHAVDAGATTIYVLQVGRVEEPLSVPRTAVDTAKVAFEIARRHRYARDLATKPDDVVIHVLPSGGALEGDDSLMAYRNMAVVRERIDRAYTASHAYLEAHA